MKPRIVRDNLQMIGTVKVGRNYTWDVEVIGEPITTKTWSITDDKALSNTDRLTLEFEDYATRFIMTKAQRKVSAQTAVLQCEYFAHCRILRIVNNHLTSRLRTQPSTRFAWRT